RQLVGALILGVAGMAPDPVPAHVVALERGFEPLPEIDILDRFLVSGAPAVALPLLDPRHHAVAQILAVGVYVYVARTLERFQCRDRRHQLHAVVGGVGFPALQFLLVIAEGEDRTPAARPRIAGTGAVGVDDNPLFAHASIP